MIAGQEQQQRVLADQEQSQRAVIGQEGLDEMRRKEDLSRDDVRDMISGMRDGESRPATMLEAQHIALMSEAAEKSRMKHMISEQQIPTEAMRMKLYTELKQASTLPSQLRSIRMPFGISSQNMARPTR